MKKLLFLLINLGVVLVFSACVGGGGVATIPSNVNKVALVSLSVSDWGGSVKGGSVGSEGTEKLINSGLADMVDYTEQKLAGKWQVRKVSTFIKDPAFLRLGEERTLTAYLPKINGQEMPLLTQGSRELKSGTITAEKAGQLCAALGVDAVALVFSEWTTKTGGIVPTSKAVSKNIVTIWDSSGRKIMHQRVDKMGTKTLGAFGVKAMNQETIKEWTDTFKLSLDNIFARM